MSWLLTRARLPFVAALVVRGAGSIAVDGSTVVVDGVPAIFAEVSSNPQLAEVVAAETGINVVTALYSDSLSDADGPADTYLNYMRYNTATIADVLTG